MIGSGKIVGKDVDVLFSIPVKDIPGYKSPSAFVRALIRMGSDTPFPFRIYPTNRHAEVMT
ncbi:hypothetical protein Pcaca05_00840 [Pectobacterium carotovorum subsp. carotovorum]|nr:hypothetical protein Pcaca05_00840 [Pectobacterium carotovorum subsp. carotovorum]